MHRWGTTPEQLATVAAKNHNYAVNNPRAQYRFPMTVEQVLADRPVTPPLTRSMCAPVGDGAAAVLVASVLAGKSNRRATVHLLGGDLTVEWNEADNHVYIEGPATTVFTGTWND